MATVHARRRGDGSVAWQVRWRERGAQRSVTYADARTADRLAANARTADRLASRLSTGAAFADVATLAEAAPAPTVAETVERHIGLLTGVTDRTREDYRRQAARHILPTLGGMPVDHVRTEHLARWVNSPERQVSSKTLANLHGLLSSVLSTAVRDGWLSDNPCRPAGATSRGRGRGWRGHGRSGRSSGQPVSMLGPLAHSGDEMPPPSLHEQVDAGTRRTAVRRYPFFTTSAIEETGTRNFPVVSVPEPRGRSDRNSADLAVAYWPAMSNTPLSPLSGTYNSPTDSIPGESSLPTRSKKSTTGADSWIAVTSVVCMRSRSSHPSTIDGVFGLRPPRTFSSLKA